LKTLSYKALALAQDFPPIPGGVSVYTENLFKNLKEQVLILAPETQEPCEIEFPPNIEVKRLYLNMRRTGIRTYISRQIALFRQSSHHIKKKQIKYVHCMHISSGLAAFLLKKIYSVPYVLYTYGSEITGQPGIIRSMLAKTILQNAAHIVTMSEFTRKAILGYNIPAERIRFLVGVDIDRFTRPGNAEATRAKYGITGTPILLTVARLVEHKGIDTVIRALPEIIKTHPDLFYLVIGEGPYRKDLEALADELNVRGHVKLIGNIPHHRMQCETEAFYSISDLFVMVSRNIEGIEAEGFGLVFLEASLSKKASVGGNSGGIGDAIIDNVTGRLVDPDNPIKVADTIRTLLSDKASLKRFGESGYERTIENFDWKTNVRDWENELKMMFS
jgi:phosphatidylinositol alpha-1,6-mannosyltransferase